MSRIQLGVLSAALALGIFIALLIAGPPGVVIAVALLVGISMAKKAPDAVVETAQGPFSKLVAAVVARPLFILTLAMLLGLVELFTPDAGAPFETGWVAVGILGFVGLSAIADRGSTSSSSRRHLGFFNGRHMAVPIG
jgi:hypothetical protein